MSASSAVESVVDKYATQKLVVSPAFSLTGPTPVQYARAGEAAIATLTVTYTHTIDAEDPGCDQTPRYGNSYDDMIARCYFNFTRLYVPAGSEFIELTGAYAGTVTSQRGEKGTQQFAGYFVLPPNDSNTLVFTYKLPADVSQQLANNEYSLRIQRQSGTDALPVTLHIGDETISTLLEGGVFEWATDDTLGAFQ